MAEADERQYVEYECKDHIATIAMNRPEKLNAVSDEVVRQLIAAMRRFDSDPDAYVAILCGRGRAFCSGADLKSRADAAPSPAARACSVASRRSKPRFMSA
jgi:enoyl-CoA hydratase/carnithine racemase